MDLMQWGINSVSLHNRLCFDLVIDQLGKFTTEYLCVNEKTLHRDIITANSCDRLVTVKCTLGYS